MEEEDDAVEDSAEDSETEQALTVAIPLDGTHAEAVRQMREAGVNVEQVIANETRSQIESAIYNTVQRMKYEGQ